MLSQNQNFCVISSPSRQSHFRGLSPAKAKARSCFPCLASIAHLHPCWAELHLLHPQIKCCREEDESSCLHGWSWDPELANHHILPPTTGTYLRWTNERRSWGFCLDLKTLGTELPSFSYKYLARRTEAWSCQVTRKKGLSETKVFLKGNRDERRKERDFWDYCLDFWVQLCLGSLS